MTPTPSKYMIGSIECTSNLSSCYCFLHLNVGSMWH